MPKATTKPPPTLTPSPPVIPADKPAHRIQFGCVRGSIWRRDAKEGAEFSVTLDRVIFDKAKNEQVSNVYEDRDVRHLAKVASDCANWIEWQRRYLAERAGRR